MNPITRKETPVTIQESKINSEYRQDEMKILFESSEEEVYV